MLRAELYECKHDINDMSEKFWHDGMVFESEISMLNSSIRLTASMKL